ncbi:MAG: response regulator [Mariprofundus sp.]|nr:response regulator [Mariprofundus sp.]
MFHIVDDDDERCMLLGSLIHRAGYDFIHFYSAVAYLKYMQTRCFEAPVALLVNYMIPNMNGSELADAVCKQLPQQHIILMASPAELEGGSIDGGRFYACLKKPIQDDVLLTLLNDLLIDQLLYPKQKTIKLNVISID